MAALQSAPQAVPAGTGWRVRYGDTDELGGMIGVALDTPIRPLTRSQPTDPARGRRLSCIRAVRHDGQRTHRAQGFPEPSRQVPGRTSLTSLLRRRPS